MVSVFSRQNSSGCEEVTLASESAVTGETWKQGYDDVNLNPNTALPIEVWLSKISEHLTAAGESSRCIAHGYSPTEDEVMDQQGLAHLKAIKVLEVFRGLSVDMS